MFPETVILVVGGDSDESEMIANTLSSRHRVIGAEKPDDALTHSDDGVDLVISQLDSPDFSGLQLLKRWKAASKPTPFLFVTDGSDVSSVVEAMKLGAGDCLIKPVNPNQLRATVERLLDSHGKADDGSSDVGRNEGDRQRIEIPPGTSLEDLERAAVEQALAQHQGNRTHAAKTLGISVRTLQRKLKAWGMPVAGTNQGNSSPSSPPGSRIVYAEGHMAHSSSPFGAHAH
jgi:DNA-binding NtrC family response regulator